MMNPEAALDALFARPISDASVIDSLVEGIASELAPNPDVRAAFALGSSARQGNHQPDKWSDIDMYIVCAAGKVAEFKSDHSWVQRLAAEHGGLLVEDNSSNDWIIIFGDLGIMEPTLVEEGATLPAFHRYRVLFDKSEGQHISKQMAERESKATPYDPHAKFAELCALYWTNAFVAAFRLERGELYSATLFAGVWIGYQLIGILEVTTPPDPNEGDIRENMEPTRRLERRYARSSPEQYAMLCEIPCRAERSDIIRSLRASLRFMRVVARRYAQANALTYAEGADAMLEALLVRLQK